MDREQLIRQIHRALGGNGWAYSNYGCDELTLRRDALESVADLFLELSSQQVTQADASSVISADVECTCNAKSTVPGLFHKGDCPLWSDAVGTLY